MRRMKRAIAMLLTLALLISVLPAQSLAYYAGDEERPTVLVDSSGRQIPVSEDWETAFPYGTFAFAVSEASVEEGGEAAVIQVYRLGGTAGRATAYLSYIPAAAEISAGVKSYANAAGANDIVIEVEDTLPIAAYQPVGKATDPEPSDAVLVEAPYTGDGAEKNDHVLSLDAAAETYQWYLYDGSSWSAVSGAVDATFVVSDADYAQYDFRCVYTADGVSYCTDSAKGVVYEKPAAEKLPPMPDDLDLNPAQTFTTLEMDPDDPYLGYVFSMTFAEDEWVKEIRVTAPDDDVAEAIKGGYFTIVDCEGGSLYDTANTLALGVYDDETPEPSTLGFAVTEIEADKSEGTAVLTVKRTGGTQNVLTLSYETEDGTAVAGKDYTAASGTIAFYGDVTEQTIEIPLINDGVETEERVSFRVILSDLLGDSEGLCTLEDTEATVSLYNTNTGEGENLATMLYDGEAVDASGDVDEAASTVAPVNVGTVTGTQNPEGEDLEGVISGYGSESEITPMTYNYGDISFSRGSDYNSYWRDWAYVANNWTYGGDINAVGGYTNSTWSGDGEKSGSGWKVKSDHKVTATLDIDRMSYRFKSYKGDYSFDVGILNHDLFGAEFTYPWASVVRFDNSDRDRVNCDVSWDWGFFTGYEYWWYTGGSLTSSWSMSETNLRGLQIGLSRHDAHDSSDDGECIIQRGALERRVFNNNLQLRIHTANDGESGNGNVATAPEGAAALTSSSNVYSDMKPSVKIKSGQGGVNWSGQLYVGSTIQVELKNTPSYDPYTGDKLNAAVYLTRKNGTVVSGAKVTKGSGNIYDIELLWNGMTDSDLNETYTINVVMTRVQDFKLDLSPSVERKTDADGNPMAEIDTDKIGQAWDLFWASAANSSNNVITIGYSEASNTAPHFDKNKLSTKQISKTSGWTDENQKPQVKQLLQEKNVQYINFNRSAEDRILYNGRIYAGNEQIWLDVADLALENATFRYYNKNYLSATSIMTADISSVGLYLDVDCNGRIDGYYDASTGYFRLDSGTKDQFIMFLEKDVDYDESLFAPVAVEWDGNGRATKYAQYFAKAFYTMTPRALTPESGHEEDKAQVLPAFVTNVTDPGEYAQLTRELQSYRYIISGKNRTKSSDGTMSEYARSSDGHLMYGASASLPQVVDIPLGGDTSPAQAQEDGTFTWTPDYQGNLLYPFDNPEPIYIEHSLAGDNVPIADDFTINDDGTTTLNGDSKAKLNGYLGSFAGNSTVALCIQKQEQTTDEIAVGNGVSSGSDISGGSDLALQSAASAPKPESSTMAERGTFPNSDYLKAMEGGGAPDTPSVNMEEAEGDFEEFEVDLGVKLPSTEIGVTDYVSVIMDGYEVGFAIGIPLGGYNSNGDAGAGGPGGEGEDESNWVSPAKANAANAEDMGKLRDFLKNPSKDTLKDTDDSYTSALDDGEMSSSGFDVGFSVSMAFLFKYNSVDNNYYFSQFSIAVSAELEYTYQQRLTPCPIVYLYVKVGFGIELGTGATVERETVEEATPEFDGSKTLKKGDEYTFDAKYKSFNITFNGKVALELLDGSGNKVDGSTRGYLTSDGDDPITATMLKQDKMTVNSAYQVRITALEDTTLSRVARVTSMETKSYWSGFSLEPEGYIEAGAGIGVEIMKFEVYIKISLGCAMTFGAWNDEANKYDPFSFDEFSFSLGLGFRVVLLVFSYEMDLISYSIQYDGETDKWTHSWSALGGLYGDEIGELSATDADGNTYGVTIRMPGDTSRTQSLYSGGNQDELSTLSYEASDAEVPFQLSGYGSSGDAFKLYDGMIAGYDYQVVTAGADNYLVYTIGREKAAHPVDRTMLVLSKLRLTSVGGKDSYGLVNPLDEDDKNQPYIILDDDGTGDLDFTAWADDSGTIHAAWVSYATAGVPADAKERPAGEPFQGENEADAMSQKNYQTYPAPTLDATEPTPVENPGETQPAAPVKADYFITAEEYGELTDAEKEAYSGEAETVGGVDYHVAAAYADYAAATRAIEAAQKAHDDYPAQKEAYDKYLEDLAAYETQVSLYETEKKAYDDWYAYFASVDAHEASVQEIAAKAAKNTVVKTASYDTTKQDGFTEPEIVSGMDGEDPVTGSFVYLPEGEGDGSVTVYAKAQHMDEESKNAAEKGYTDYLKAIHYDPTDVNTDEATRTIGSYRLAYQSGLWDAYGKGSSICVSADGVDQVAQLNLAANQILDNFEVTEINGTYYVAYTTSEMQYVNADGNQADAEDAVDLVIIKRLFLRTFTVADGQVVWTNHGTAGDEQKGVLLRTAYDFDTGDGGSDGMYQGGALNTTQKSAYQDPYFANLQFLRGDLGESLKGASEDFELMSAGDLEDFLLFEMNGCTYVIRQASLISIAAANAEKHTGSIIPFFAYENQAGAQKAQTTGRAEVTIGADGAGNLSAVYVAPVANTTNNAIYLSKYDPQTSRWGAGTMLAMNHMDVYEDSVSQGWSSEDAGEAYLGQLTGYDNGGMDQFVFSNLAIALGQQAVTNELGLQSEQASASSMSREEALDLLGQGGQLTAMSSDGEVDLGGQLTASQLDLLGQSGTGTKDTLLVITQGTMTYLREKTVDGEDLILPMADSDAQSLYETAGEGDYWYNRAPGVGMYAVSYGVGGQAIGEGQLTFANYDFSSGAELYANLSFVNTGDVGIRGSEAQPITVSLVAEEGAVETVLSSWSLTDSVIPGQKVQLSGGFTLPKTLPTGTKLTLSVRENDYYANQGGDPFGAVTELMTVEEKPELGYESMSVYPLGVDENGDTILSVDFIAGNRGVKTAEDVFVQFSYESGTTDNGEPIYTPLSITGHSLTVDTEAELTTAAVTGDDLPNGILYLNGTDGQNIQAGYGRRVHGTITVPPELYQGSLTGSLNLRMELYSAADNTTSWTSGLVEAEHGEYNTADNARVVQIENRTFFSVASKVTIPMGNTMRLPVSVTTTTGDTVPVVLAEEFPAHGESRHLGVMNYQAGTYQNGADPSGTLVLAPSSTGSGFIRLMDVNTNWFFDVAYTVTDAAEGINIFLDNEMFAFKNSDGGDYNPGETVGTQDWSFQTAVDSWGADGTEPYLNNLSRGKVGAKFTFTTQAQSIDLVFNGEVQVESTFPGFRAQTVSASGGDGKNSGEYATVYFGKNETNYTHEVTITVTKAAGTGQYADFDRLVEHYGSGGTPLPAEDEASPHIYWSRSFPDTASLELDGKVAMSAFVLDDGTLASVTINGQKPAKVTEHAEGFWEIELELDSSDSGTMKVAAQDTAGNRTTQNITVDWFNSTVSAGASADAPELDAWLEKEDGTDLLDGVSFESGDRALIAAASVPSDAKISVIYLNASTGEDGEKAGLIERTLSAESDGRFPAASNGWYLVTAKNAAPNERQWTTQVLTMTRIDTAAPTVTLDKPLELQSEGGDPVLAWTVYKDVSTSAVKNTIAEVSINGQPLSISLGQTALSGSFAATHGGKYTALATDTANNTGEGSFNLTDVPIKLAEGKTTAELYSISNARKDVQGSKANGKVEVLPDYLDVLVGGTYDLSLSSDQLAAGDYRGVYEWKLVMAENPADGVALEALLANDGWTTERELSGLLPGKYVLYIRDVQERTNTNTVAAFPLTVGDESIAVTLEKKIEKETDQDGNVLATKASLVWSASKGDGALLKMPDVTLNEFSLAQDVFQADGSFGLTHTGTYTLTAAEGTTTETATVTVNPDEIPIAVQSGAISIKVDNPLTADEDSTKSLATLHNPWNQANDNGRVDVDVSVLIGGEYDKNLSTPEDNSYAGSYEWQLRKLGDFDETYLLSQLKEAWYKAHPEIGSDEEIPAEDLAEIQAEVERQRAEANEGTVEADWNSGSQADGLSSGRYRLLVRDAQNPDSGNILEVLLILDDESIKFQADSKPASSRGARNGQITAAASGGYGLGGTYQFIVRPISDESQMLEDLTKLTDPLDSEAYPDWSDPVWQPAELSGGVASSTVFEGLPSGWYQVAVRPMVGATSEQMQELFTLYKAYDAARKELADAQEANTEAGITKVLSSRKASVNTALTTWRNAAAGTEKDAAWDAYTALVEHNAEVLAKLDAWKDAGFRNGDARTAYETAVDTYLRVRITADAAARLTAAADDHTAKEKAYSDQRTALETATETAYTNNPSVWENAATAAVYVSYRSPSTKIEVKDLEYPDDETVKVTYSDNKRELSDSAEDRLIADNAERDILAGSDTMLVVIPRGTLSKGDDIDQMLMPFRPLPGKPEGSVVQWTGSSGETMLVGWSHVTADRVSYIASRPGSYEIVSNPVSFQDVPETFWGYEEIGFTAAREMFNGVGDGQFHTNGVMTRAMFVTVLGRLADADVEAYGEKAFRDVDPDTWYGPYVAWAADHGIVNGVGGERFAPNAPVTREQICTVLSRYLEETGLRLDEDGEAVSFRDADQISGWAGEAVERFQRAGIVEGDPSGSFLPRNNATRAQCAAIYARLIQAVLGAYGG